MSKENEFDMSLFDADSIELNLDLTPEDLEETPDDLNQPTDPPTEEPPVEKPEDINNPNEEPGAPETVVKDEVDEEEGTEGTQDPSPNIYSSLATVLSEKGLIPSSDLKESEIESIDNITDLLKAQVDAQTKNYIVSKIGEEGYDALEKGITLQEYQQHQNNVQTLDNITEASLGEDMELSKKIIYQDYISQGISEARAMRLLKKSIDAGDESIIEDAKESLQSLKAVETKRLENLAAQRVEDEKQERLKQDKIDNDLKNAIYNKKHIVENVPIDKTMQDKVYESITKVVGQSPDGVMENKLMRDRRENPIEFDTRMYYLYELTNGFNDFSKVVAKTTSDAVSKLEAELRRTRFDGSSAPSYIDDPNSYDGKFGDEIIL